MFNVCIFENKNRPKQEFVHKKNNKHKKRNVTVLNLNVDVANGLLRFKLYFYFI